MTGKDPYDFDEDGSAFADDASWGMSTNKNNELLKLKKQQHNAWQSRGQFCITFGGEVIAKQRQQSKSCSSSSVGYRIVRLSKGKLPAVVVGEPEFDVNDPVASIRALMDGLRNWYAGLQGPKRKEMETLANQLESEFLPGTQLSISVMPDSSSDSESSQNQAQPLSQEPLSRSSRRANKSDVELTPEQQAVAQARRAELEKISQASTYKVVKGSIAKPTPKKKKN